MPENAHRRAGHRDGPRPAGSARPPYDTPQKYGNAFHALLKNVIKNLHDPDLRAEISYLDGKPANYGTAGSVRYDVLEDAPARKLCIHDLKTGQGGLTFSRSTELARYAGAAFRNYTGFYVIEHRAP